MVHLVLQHQVVLVQAVVVNAQLTFNILINTSFKHFRLVAKLLVLANKATHFVAKTFNLQIGVGKLTTQLHSAFRVLLWSW